MADARLKAVEARAILARGSDPTAKEDPGLLQSGCGSANPCFSRVRSRVEHDVCPALGRQHLDEITPRDVLDMVRDQEARWRWRWRALRNVTEVFTLPVAEGLSTVKPARDVQGGIGTQAASAEPGCLMCRPSMLRLGGLGRSIRMNTRLWFDRAVFWADHDH